MDRNEYDGTMTFERMMAELNMLCGYYEDMEAKARVIPAGPGHPMPVMVGILTNDDDESRVITHSFLPLGKDDAEFTIFLQSYVELPLPEKPIDRATILEVLNELNGVIPAGTAYLMYSEHEKVNKIGLRWTSGWSAFVEIDEGAFCEGLFLMSISCDLIEGALADLASGSTVEEVMDRVKGN